MSQLDLSSCSAIRPDGSRASGPDRSATGGPAEVRRFLVAALCMIPAAMLAIGFCRRPRRSTFVPPIMPSSSAAMISGGRC